MNVAEWYKARIDSFPSFSTRVGSESAELDLTLRVKATGHAFTFQVSGTREDLETWRAAGLDVHEVYERACGGNE